ncbi:hypothetical protein Tsubulata_021615 [Turnera subulata]|uniref:DUF2470 domain-containing protein n=1 Tax=Turnera subulata TaxID=218843 RepID=A0A9Q0FWC1_9ROSI|nr:hypothetical protein Tsubulata_021615 [Turnera subulata]
MHLHTQSLSFQSSLLRHFSLSPIHLPKPQFAPPKQNPFRRISLKCSLSAVSDPATTATATTTRVVSSKNKPFPAEVARTIMELSSVGTLSTLTHEGWPVSVGVRFAVDDDGTPVLCLSDSSRQFSVDTRSSLHVQSGMRTPQLTIQGNLDKPEDGKVLKWLHSTWKKRFGEEVDENLIYVVSVERVLQMEDFMEAGAWISSSDYKQASPDPLRDFAEAFVSEINAKNMEDVYRFSNIFVDTDFQVSEAKMIWVDRLGFDMRLSCPQKGVFDVRIPFPREVTDEKGAKSSFNGMSQLAWEVEKNYVAPDFEKAKELKQISYQGL